MSAAPTPEPLERSVAPTVARPHSGVSGPAIGIGAVVGALLLFGVLDARRRALTAPAVTTRGTELVASQAPPPLYIPPEPAMVAPQPAPLYPLKPSAMATPAPRPLPTALPAPVQPAPQQAFTPPPIAERPPRTSGGATLVVDTSQPRGQGDDQGPLAALTGAETNTTASRARAGTIANRATTVPQGTLIPAVLETAFSSARAGFARALVQRDVRGFDGTQVLIPRGSRLIGEYRSDATPGQNRALVNWTRLIRPDGVTIAIGSPATDTVGTGGVKAKVNSHFFARFAGAILQSALDVGVNLASRSADSPVIVALPGSLQGNTATVTRQTQIPPTLSVKQGTSISVFVARDLDFTEVEGRQ